MVYYKLFDSEAVKWKRAQDRHRRKQVGLSPGVGPAQCLPVIPSLEALIPSPQDLKFTAQALHRLSQRPGEEAESSLWFLCSVRYLGVPT